MAADVMPSSAQARTMRTAISPRLATSILLINAGAVGCPITCDAKQQVTRQKREPVADSGIVLRNAGKAVNRITWAGPDANCAYFDRSYRRLYDARLMFGRLPETIDPIQLAEQGARLTGELPLPAMTRLAGACGGGAGGAAAAHA